MGAYILLELWLSAATDDRVTVHLGGHTVGSLSPAVAAEFRADMQAADARDGRGCARRDG